MGPVSVGLRVIVPVVDEPPAPPCRVVVAVVLTCRGRTALLRRSQEVAHDRGLWHCVTGYVEPGCTPYEQALTEVHEETGLGAVDLVSVTPGGVLELADQHGRTWQVHTFTAETAVRRLVLDREHVAYRWLCPQDLAVLGGTVDWLADVLAAAG